MFGAKKEDIHSDDYKKMRAFSEQHEDTPDGAFFALAEQHGWYAADWGWFNEVEELNGI